MLGRYPLIKAESFTNTKKVLQAMEEGVCEAAIVGECEY
jgi:hypothetical protein